MHTSRLAAVWPLVAAPAQAPASQNVRVFGTLPLDWHHMCRLQGVAFGMDAVSVSHDLICMCNATLSPAARAASSHSANGRLLAKRMRVRSAQSIGGHALEGRTSAGGGGGVSTRVCDERWLALGAAHWLPPLPPPACHGSGSGCENCCDSTPLSCGKDVTQVMPSVLA